MSTTFHHRHDRAVIAFTGALDWAGAVDLAGAVETVVESYFYRLVELVVTSPGGDLRALRFVVDALAAHRARGVRLRTRVLSDAESAAAVLCCIGDERIAAPGARLLFHASRAVNVEAVTARAGAAIAGALARHDTSMLALLVERVLAGVDPDRALDAEPADRAVLERLAPDEGAPGRRPRLRALARTLGRRVTAAVHAGDRAALERLYRRLLDAEYAVSAPLARTLGLIDTVATPGAERAAPAAERACDGLLVPEWAALFPPRGAVARTLLARHILVLGETGGGKTASAILPIVAAMARAPARRLGAALVIDPKCELAAVIERLRPRAAASRARRHRGARPHGGPAPSPRRRPRRRALDARRDPHPYSASPRSCPRAPPAPCSRPSRGATTTTSSRRRGHHSRCRCSRSC